MPDLHFAVENAAPVANAATPTIVFAVRITNSEPDAVQSIALRVQVQIEPVRRRYSPEEQEHLKDLFGEPERWSTSVHPLLWANLNLNVPGFTGGTLLEVQVPCTFDFNVAVTKYAYGLEAGEIPTSLMFSGTVFYAGRAGLQIAQIPWDRNASYHLPVFVWKEMMNLYYPNTAWLTLRRDVFERLCEYKSRHGIATWEQVMERMLGVTAGVNS
jgi:Family of unknown function (DUF6084)